MGGGAIDQRRQDAEARDRRTRALTCRFGGDCWKGLECAFDHDHSQVEKQIFVDERELRVRKLMVRCGFCVRGECKFQGRCARSLRVAAVVSDAADSDYESADSNDCTDDGSASDSGSSGEKWESGSEGVLREESDRRGVTRGSSPIPTGDDPREHLQRRAATEWPWWEVRGADQRRWAG